MFSLHMMSYSYSFSILCIEFHVAHMPPKLTRKCVLSVCCSMGGDHFFSSPIPDFYPKLLPILKWHQTHALSTRHALFFDVKVSVRSSVRELLAVCYFLKILYVLMVMKIQTSNF